MKLIEIGNLTIATNRIEGVELIPRLAAADKDIVKIFLANYTHSIPFEDENDSTNFYENVLAEMHRL